jgi:hypothetical protein
MKRWFPLTYALNSLNRSLGLADAYPFTLAPKVIDKLRFVHRVIASAGSTQEAMPKQISEPGASSADPAPAKPADALPDDKSAPAPSGGTAVA